MHAGDVVVLCQLLSVESFTTGRGTRDENLDGVQATERVELLLEGADVLADTKLSVPLELFLLDELILVLLLHLEFFRS